MTDLPPQAIDSPVSITARNTVGIKLGPDGYSFGIGDNGIELFASTPVTIADQPSRVDYGLLTLAQAGSVSLSLGNTRNEPPGAPDAISTSLAGASVGHAITSNTSLLGYGGLSTRGELTIGARLEHNLSPDRIVSLDLQRHGSKTAFAAAYEWKKDLANTTRQKYKLAFTLDNGKPSLDSSYTREKKIDLENLGYLRTQLGASAKLGPSGQFDVAAQASVMKDLYTYKIGAIPVAVEAGINQQVGTSEKPKTSLVWKLTMPL